MQHTSASAFAGGIALKAIVRVLPAGKAAPTPCRAGIDTLSDVSLAPRELLTDIHPISPDLVHSTGAVTEFTEQGFIGV